jgi:glycosyltransferase involved in cell wall biosynthesis
MPKVSICIPTYNRSHYLTHSVNSVLQQTYRDFELIICDDGSTDDTPTQINQWQDSRLRYLRHPQNIGRSRNMRSGFDAAQGEYFLKFDDDDGLSAEFLAKTVAVLDAHPEIDFVCSNHWVIDAQGERDEAATRENSVKWGKDRLKQGFIPNLIRETFDYQSLQVGSTLFRRTCLAEVDYMRPQADGCEDFDLLVRLALAGKQAYFLPELLMEYRFHGAQTSLKQDIHFLSAKRFCLDSYSLPTEDLEVLRRKKLADIERILGLRLIEKGETIKGRELLQKAESVLGKSSRGTVGLILSYLPVSFRPKDYSEKVREEK